MVGFVRELEIENDLREQRSDLLKAAADERPCAVHWSVWSAAYKAGEIGVTYSGRFAQNVPVLLTSAAGQASQVRE